MARRPVSNDSKNIGAVMKKVLNDIGVTQEQAAYRIGLSGQSVINCYILGKREVPLEVIKKFSKEFGVPMNVLLGETEAEYMGISDRTNEQLMANIIAILDQWLETNKLWMKPSDKAMIISNLYKDNQCEPETINASLSMLQRLKSEIFLSKNNTRK